MLLAKGTKVTLMKPAPSLNCKLARSTKFGEVLIPEKSVLIYAGRRISQVFLGATWPIKAKPIWPVSTCPLTLWANLMCRKSSRLELAPKMQRTTALVYCLPARPVTLNHPKPDAHLSTNHSSAAKLLGRPGCALLQPYDMEVGAGTSHTATFFARTRP